MTTCSPVADAYSRVPERAIGRRAALLGATPGAAAEARETGFSEELKLFATGWLGGLVFFGTFLA